MLLMLFFNYRNIIQRYIKEVFFTLAIDLPSPVADLYSFLSMLTLPMLRLLSTKAQWRKDFWKPSTSCHVGTPWTPRWVPMCQGFNHFSGFLHHFVRAKLANSSITVYVWLWSKESCSKLSFKPRVHSRNKWDYDSVDRNKMFVAFC